MKINTKIILLISLLLVISSYAKKKSSSTTMRRRNSAKAQTKVAPRDTKKFPLPQNISVVDSKSGSVFTLADVQEVNCFQQKGPLTKFHLYGENGWWSNKIGYEWGCMDNAVRQGQNVGFTTVSSANKVNYAQAGSSPKILNNVEVDCKDAFISAFKLQKTNNDLYYTASCMNLKQKSGSCETKQTNAANISWLGLFSDTVSNLDQLPLEAPANKALVYFKLVVQSGKVVYEYKACEVDTTAAVIETAPASRQVKRINADNLNLNLDRKRRRRY